MLDYETEKDFIDLIKANPKTKSLNYDIPAHLMKSDQTEEVKLPVKEKIQVKKQSKNTLPMHLSNLNLTQLKYINNNDKFLKIPDSPSNITVKDFLYEINKKLFTEQNSKGDWINKSVSVLFDITTDLMNPVKIKAAKKLIKSKFRNKFKINR